MTREAEVTVTVRYFALLRQEREAAEERVTTAAEERVTTAAEERVTTAAEERVTTAAEERVTTAAEERVTTAAEERVTTAAEERVTTAAATASDLYAELRDRFRFSLDQGMLRVAVNSSFVEWTHPLRDGDVVVFIPPVAGG